ncbi:hypothetical protein [Microcoleus sp. S13_B4]|uniref:hypothetical protein n=1 Tax=Microcoleus sp. S13_B4 TaxID=3055408 RepID=UPI002FD332EA
MAIEEVSWETGRIVGADGMRAAAFGVMGVEGCVGCVRGNSRDKSGICGSQMLRGKPGIGSGVGEGTIELLGIGTIELLGIGAIGIPTHIGKGLIRSPVSLFPI